MKRRFYLCVVVYVAFLAGLFFREGVGLLTGRYERIQMRGFSTSGENFDVEDVPGEMPAYYLNVIWGAYERRGQLWVPENRFPRMVYRDRAFWYLLPGQEEAPFWLARKYGIKVDRVTGKVFAPGNERGVAYGYLAMPVGEVEAALAVKDGGTVVEKVGVPWEYYVVEDEERGDLSIFRYRVEEGILSILFEKGKPPVVGLSTNVWFL